MNIFIHIQLPDGLIAQLVEHCTGIAEVIVRIPFRPEFISGSNFTFAKVMCITAIINQKYKQTLFDKLILVIAYYI